ncbi:MAG: hypothetical protein WBD24_07200 [Candidatus Omnitrophota bacterium]
MVHENEVLMFLLGAGVMIFIISNRQRVRSIPASNILFIGYAVLLAGWMLTILEGFFLEKVLNYLEHISYAVSSILIVVWCWKVFGRGRDTA